MSKMTFICEHFDGQKITFETQSELLTDVLSDLESFLKGCGYHFNGVLDFVDPESDTLDQYVPYETMTDSLTEKDLGDIVIR